MTETDKLKQIEDLLLTVGIHCAAVHHRDGSVTKRGDYGNGWNACHKEFTSRISKILYNEKESKHQKELNLLYAMDAIRWEKEGMSIPVSDTFHYACADAEDLPEEFIPEVARLALSYGWAGIIYWVALRRGYNPEIPGPTSMVEAVRELETKRSRNWK